MKTAILIEKGWIIAMLLVSLVMISIFGINTNAYSQTVPLVSCNGGYIPQGTPCGAGGYYGQQQGNNGVINIGGINISKKEGLWSTAGALLGATANNNKVLHAVEGAALGYAAENVYEALVDKPQQVAMAPSQQIVQQVPQCTGENKILGHVSKINCPWPEYAGQPKCFKTTSDQCYSP